MNFPKSHSLEVEDQTSLSYTKLMLFLFSEPLSLGTDFPNRARPEVLQMWVYSITLTFHVLHLHRWELGKQGNLKGLGSVFVNMDGELKASASNFTYPSPQPRTEVDY